MTEPEDSKGYRVVGPAPTAEKETAKRGERQYRRGDLELNLEDVRFNMDDPASVLQYEAKNLLLQKQKCIRIGGELVDLVFGFRNLTSEVADPLRLSLKRLWTSHVEQIPEQERLKDPSLEEAIRQVEGRVESLDGGIVHENPLSSMTALLSYNDLLLEMFDPLGCVASWLGIDISVLEELNFGVRIEQKKLLRVPRFLQPRSEEGGAEEPYRADVVQQVTREINTQPLSLNELKMGDLRQKLQWSLAQADQLSIWSMKFYWEERVPTIPSENLVRVIREFIEKFGVMEEVELVNLFDLQVNTLEFVKESVFLVSAAFNAYNMELAKVAGRVWEWNARSERVESRVPQRRRYRTDIG